MQGAKLQAATAIDSEKEGERLRKISTDVVLLPSALVVLLCWCVVAALAIRLPVAL